MSQTFKLIEEGHLKPIKPCKLFSFGDIGDAFRYMRSGNHIGKIVITSGLDRGEKVPVGTQSDLDFWLGEADKTDW